MCVHISQNERFHAAESVITKTLCWQGERNHKLPDARIRNHRIHYRVTADYATIRPEDGCDESVTEAIAALVNSSIVKSHNLIVDLSHVEYVETPGFRWLIRQFRHLQSEGRCLVVCGLPKSVQRSFKALRLDSVIPCASDAMEARQMLNVDIKAIAV